MVALEFPSIQILNLSKNIGSSGGFFEGIKWAYENDFEWFWLMDDDGIPENKTLEHLLGAKDRLEDIKIFNSLVLDRNNKEDIAFGYNWKLNFHTQKEQTQFFKRLTELKSATQENILNGFPQFYNSSLIHKDVIREIGLPLKEMFIRGDEVEFAIRAQRKGYKTVTVVDSTFYHPNPTNIKLKFIGYSFYYEPMPEWKNYYAIRNLIIIERLYGSKIDVAVKLFKIFAKNLIIIFKFRRKEKPLKEIYSVLKAILEGLQLHPIIQYPINNEK